jgi:hypothetical protein
MRFFAGVAALGDGRGLDVGAAGVKSSRPGILSNRRPGHEDFAPATQKDLAPATQGDFGPATLKDFAPATQGDFGSATQSADAPAAPRGLGTGRCAACRTISRIVVSGLLTMLIVFGGGCSMVPRNELADCAKRCRVLQAEAGQLKDETLSLRSQNRDLSQRAVDDGKRTQVLEEANRRLEESVAAYQHDRDELAAAFDRLQAQLQSAGESAAATAARPSP